jgi:hypothetical protein
MMKKPGRSWPTAQAVCQNIWLQHYLAPSVAGYRIRLMLVQVQYLCAFHGHFFLPVTLVELLERNPEIMHQSQLDIIVLVFVIHNVAGHRVSKGSTVVRSFELPGNNNEPAAFISGHCIRQAIDKDNFVFIHYREKLHAPDRNKNISGHAFA